MKTRLYWLCGAADLPADGARGFSLARAGADTDLIVIRRAGRVHAYLNRCPHTGVNLDWKPGEFLDSTGQSLQCSTHGALFRVADGYCIFGPCAGQSLAAIPIHEQDGLFSVRLPEPGEAGMKNPTA